MWYAKKQNYSMEYSFFVLYTHLFISKLVLLCQALFSAIRTKRWFLTSRSKRGSQSINRHLNHDAECYNKDINTLLWKQRGGSWAKLHWADNIWAGHWRLSRCSSGKETKTRHGVRGMFQHLQIEHFSHRGAIVWERFK